MILKNKPKILCLVVLGICLLFFYCKGTSQTKSDDQTYTPKAGRTYVFSRSQLTYSLGNDDYLHHWVDIPLFVDPSLNKNKPDDDLIGSSEYSRMEQTGKNYGLDGFSFFPQSARRTILYSLAQSSAAKSVSNLASNPASGSLFILNEFTSDAKMSKLAVVKKALSNPQSYKINGKVVFTSYNADKESLLSWQKTLLQIKLAYKDQIIFLPSLINYGGKSMPYWIKKFQANSITQQDVTSIKSYLRTWATATDGLYFSYAAGIVDKDRKFYTQFYQDFVIRLMKEILAEPQFKDKYFGLSAVVGHENSTRFGYTLNSDGTKTLRHSFEAAMGANPDIINIPEWDEQNENTSLRPTVYNESSSTRIMRYYMAKIRKQNLTPIVGDDVNMPNLILSYRKTLVLGEKLEIEVLNVPDNNENKALSAVLTLKSPSGNVVYTSARLNFSSGTMSDNTVTIPSETLAANTVLKPHLDIQSANGPISIETGLHYIELRPTWNWDYKWVKQPLRDILKTQATFSLTPSAGNTAKKTGIAAINSTEPLAYAQILDNDDVIYSQASNTDQWQDNASQAIIRLQWRAMGGASDGLAMHGSISLKNATSQWLISYYGKRSKTNANSQTLQLEGLEANYRRQQALLAIPRSALKNASLSIDIPGIYTGSVPLQQIVDNTVFSIPGPKGFNLVISNYTRQNVLPDNLNTAAVNFTRTFTPDLPGSIITLQAISTSGHIYYSSPTVASTPSADKTSITVYSDTQKQPVNLTVAANYVPDITYNFSPKYGSALISPAGRPFWGMLGGYFADVTERGGGSSSDDTPFINLKDYPKGSSKTAPDWVKTETGDYALNFDGKGTFVTLPQGIIPRRAGFTINMDIKPHNAAGKQVILANRSLYEGSITIFTQNGALMASYNGEISRVLNKNFGLNLPAEQWSHLTIKCNQKDIQIMVNNKPGNIIPIKGPGLYDTATVLGGFGKDWFYGLIKSLHIQHTASL